MLNSNSAKMKKTPEIKYELITFADNVKGKVGVPILLYFLGVPGMVVIFIWLFFFRGS